MRYHGCGNEGSRSSRPPSTWDNPSNLENVRQKAEKVGAQRAYVVDARHEFAEGYVLPALQANALYEGVYPLSTALARPLIGRHLVDIARTEGASLVAHGCTGKGNDQVRFDLCTTALAPDLKVIAPAREWKMTREQEIEYARARGVPVPVEKVSPYSTDENLGAGRSNAAFSRTRRSSPRKRRSVGHVLPWKHLTRLCRDGTISFERGTRVALDGERQDFLRSSSS